jgi:hypothetical protein
VKRIITSIAAIAAAGAAASATAAPIYHSAGLRTYVQAANWPPMQGGVEDSKHSGEGRFYPNPIGPLPSSFSFDTAAIQSVTDGDIERTISASASLDTSWISQRAGTIELFYTYHTENILAGDSLPAGDGFDYYFQADASGDFLVDYSVSGATDDQSPNLRFGIVLWKYAGDLTFPRSAAGFEDVTPQMILSGASDSLAWPVDAGAFYLFQVYVGGNEAGGLGTTMGSASGIFSFAAPVPLPPALPLLGAALSAIGLVARRKRARTAG